MRRPRPIAVAAACAVLVASAPAAALDPPRWHLGGSLGFAHLWGGPSSPGLVTGLHATYAINDAWKLHAAADATVHPGRGQWAILSGGLGAGYVIDVDRWIPWVAALAGPAAIVSTDPLCGASLSEPCSALRLNAELRWGLDYQLQEHLAVGAAGRYQMVLLGDAPWMTVGVVGRVEFTWGK